MKFTTTLPKERGKKPGRPKKEFIDSIRSRVWFWTVSDRCGKHTGYSVEKYFYGKNFERRNDWPVRTCKFDKYRLGKHVPSAALVNKIEAEFEGTKQWLKLPLWKVLRSSRLEIEELYEILRNLRPGIANLLFFESIGEEGFSSQRKDGLIDILKILERESDIDALVAAIGLIHEAIYFNDPFRHYLIARTVFRIFTRVAAAFPLRFVAEPLYKYLCEQYLSNEEYSDWNQHLASFNLLNALRATNNRILLIEDFDLLKHHFYAPNSCLYLAEKYLTPGVLKLINYEMMHGSYKNIRQLPEVRKLSRSLKRWEMRENNDSKEVA